MPAITAADIQELILLEVGDVNALTGDPPASPQDGVLYAQLPLLWQRYAAKDFVAPGLRELYVKRAALRMLLAVLAPRRLDVADTSAGLTIKANQIWQHYWDLYECVKGEIDAAEKESTLSGGAFRQGQLVTRAPVTPSYPPDGNSLHYGGSTYRRRRVTR